MGGDGYALLRAESDTPLAQLRSKENLARSSLARRVPKGIGEGFGWYTWIFIERCVCGGCSLKSPGHLLLESSVAWKRSE